MSRIYDALKKLEAGREAPADRPARFDAIRMEQLLDLQRALLLRTDDASDLPDRLVHRVGSLLGVAGAAVGVLEDRSYRLIATYGVGYEDRRPSVGADIAPALTGGRPVVLHRTVDGAAVRAVILPFSGEVTGALHLTVPETVAVADEQLELGRLVAGFVGIALANMRMAAASGR